MKIILVLLFSITLVIADYWSVVYISRDMKLKKSDIKNIYFKRLKQKNGYTIIALNLSSSHPARIAFLKQVLNTDLETWSQYYSELYFRGIRSPTVLKSEKSILKYLEKVDGVIAYIPSSKMDNRCIEIMRFKL